MLKLLPKQINVINSGSESDIYNKIQIESDAESNNRQTEKTRKM